MEKETIEGYRLSPQQEQLWSLQQTISSYALQCYVVTLVHGRLNRELLEAAIKAVTARHEILRTGFEQLGGMTTPLQVVHEFCSVQVEESDWSDLQPALQQQKLDALVLEIQRKDPDVQRSPILTVWLARLSAVEHVLFISMPAMRADAYSLQNLVSELASFYGSDDQPAGVREDPVQYADFSEWQHELLESDGSIAAKRFWRSQNIPTQESFELGMEKHPSLAATCFPASVGIEIHAEQLGKLEEISRSSSVSLLAVVLGAWQLLLWRHLQQSSTSIGFYVENRRYAELQGVIGLLAKIVPVASKLDDSMSFVDFVRGLRDTIEMVYEFQETFSENQLGYSDQANFSLPFQFSYQRNKEAIHTADLSFQIASCYECISAFKMKLSCNESTNGLDIRLHYDSSLYDHGDASLLVGQLNALLQSICESPSQPIAHVSVLPPEQREMILNSWCGFDRSYPRDKSIAELFELQAKKTPNVPALVLGHEVLTYEELNRRSNQLGNLLRRKGISTEMRVGLLLERSVEMVVGILAVLKAGAAYVPLDPSYPQERLKYMIEDAKIELVLEQQHTRDRLQDHELDRITLDEGIQRTALTRESGQDWKRRHQSSQLAYVIYTSGSTGKPKGVMISHEAILYRLCWAMESFPMESTDAVLQKTAFTFDASVWEILLPLLTGARLVLAKPGAQGDTKYLIETIEKERITVLQLVPSMLRIFLQEPSVVRCESTLRRVFSGGEALPRETVVQFHKELRGVKLHNLYGPTETSIDAASWNCDREPTPSQMYMPLGYPLTNARIYILDESQDLVPAGITGEICIGGDGLSRGYTRQPDLTADRFIPDSYSGKTGVRLYRTGDLGRFRSDGVIEFLGRKDEQVKVRGYRVELGEIEAALSSHPDVHEAAVAAFDDESGGKRLVGYVVLRPLSVDSKPHEPDFKVYLSGRLPGYLIPSVIMEIAELPRMTNGKLNRRSLPLPDFDRTSHFVAPRTGTEEILAQLWSEVLKIQTVSTDKNFFDAGGHSLLATQLIARVRETFRVDIALSSLFENPTVEGLAQEIEQNLQQFDTTSCRNPISRQSDSTKRKLSYAQQRLWFLDQLEPESVVYNLAAGIELKGQLDIAVLERSLNEVIRRHESLRTHFAVGEDGEPTQVVSPREEVGLKLHVHQITEETAEEREAEMRRLVAAEAATPFFLTVGPLIRVNLLSLADQHYVALFTLHHIVSDGWSQGLIVEEVCKLYASYIRNQSSPLKDLAIQYGDYAAWQREWLNGGVLETQLDYWRRHLSGIKGVLDLPTKYPRPSVPSYRGAHYRRSLDPALSRSLADLASREHVTLYMLLLASLQVLLWRYTGELDIAIGSPIANRTRKETEDLVGFFVNTLVMRIQIDPDETFSQLLRRVRDAALGAYAHQDVPFEKLVEELKPDRDLSRAPLFQVMFALQNMPGQKLELPGLRVKPLETESSISKFDLTFFVSEEEGELNAVLEYAVDLFTQEAIERLWGNWEELLRNIAEMPLCTVAALPMLRAEERQNLLHQWNNTGEDFALAGNVAKLFEDQVERTPDATAVSFDQHKLTYAELNHRANALASQLIEKGVSADRIVGLLVGRNLNFLVSMLAVWKAGGAYLPLDSRYPLDRLKQIVEQSGLGWILVEHREAALADELSACVPSNTKPVVIRVTDDSYATSDAVNPAPRSTGKNLAYVFYTSGSTGVPKGAMVEQEGMQNHLYAKIRELGLSASDRVAQTASQNFDISVWQLIAGLLLGSQIEIVSDEIVRDPHTLSYWVRDREITILELVPSLVDAILHEVKQVEAYASLRWLLVTGETVSPHTCRRWLEQHPNIPIVNAYGPTECSDDVTHYTIRGPIGAIDRVPIGRALPNLRLYVLDQQMEPVPCDVSGQLYVGGLGVGRGYLNDPYRTSEAFVPDPFGVQPGGRLYQTRDAGRYREDGAIEFLGRLDHQVKIHGFRIELGEIEAVLTSHANVAEAAVLAREDERGGQRLVAYVMLRRSHPEEVGAGDLKSFLQQKLPGYMVPAAIVLLAEMPRTSNGKLDRKLLPKPASQLPHMQSIAPQTVWEILLADIWADCLKVERVGILDNFFELGGHSLLATQVMSRVRKIFRVENLPLRKIFETPTVQGLAQAIADELQEDTTPIPARIHPERAPVSFMQRRLWFQEQLGPGSSVYNLSSAVQLHGPLNSKWLELSMNAVMQRHDALRTYFEPTDSGEPEQIVVQELKITLDVQEVEGATTEERWLEVRRLAELEAGDPFDLSSGPLVRAKLLRISEQDHVALFTLHHIISDGWSQALLLNEIGRHYTAYAENRQVQMEPLSIQYGDYAAWQRDRFQGERLDEQLKYWRMQLEGTSGMLELPTDRLRPAVQSYRGAHHRVALDADLGSGLKALARQTNTTLYMVLLAAWNVLLWRYTGQTNIVLGTPIANRMREETEKLMGFFANTLVMRTQIDPGETFAALLVRVREFALGAYANQDIPFEKLVEELRPERDLSRSPIFQVMFAFQNMPVVNLTIPGLTAKVSDVESHTSKFDLTLFISESEEDRLSGWVEYSTDLFDESTIDRMVHQFTTLIRAIVHAPATIVAALPLLDAYEQKQIVHDWNPAQDSYEHPEDDLVTLFEAQVMQRPDAVALRFGDDSLCYAELNQRSNAIANMLVRRGIRPEDVVGLAVPRSIEMVIALLGILKAGAAYLPLDPGYPSERIKFMMKDAQPKMLLALSSVRAKIPAGTSCVVLDEPKTVTALASESSANPGRLQRADLSLSQNAAYVIYTSGSTGTPKGVVITHGNVVRLFAATRQYFDFGADDTWTLFHSYAFDVSVWEIWGALLYGGRLVVVPHALSRSPAEFLKLMLDEKVTVLSQTPSAFYQLIQADEENPGLGQHLELRTIVFGGEALDFARLKGWYERHPEDQPRLINMYGITETTVHVTYMALEKTSAEIRSSLIGLAMPDLRLYVLNEHLDPLPVGVRGELFVAGAGLARGYLNRPDLTAQRFLPDPFGPPGERMYRTGDVVQWRADRSFEYIGRIDRQVKIRGYRIELGEIEAALIADEAVHEAAVVVHEQRLCGYVVMKEAAASSGTGRLKDYLREKLPDYMVPAVLVRLERMPLTSNGKLDRRALPRPDMESGDVFVAPRTAREQTLARIWADVLGAKLVGIDDNYFNLGGDSIRSIQIQARARDAEIDFSLQELFRFQTIRGLAEGMVRDQQREVIYTEPFSLVGVQDREKLPGEVEDAYPLAMVQRGMLFHQAYASQEPVYHNINSYHLRMTWDSVKFRAAVQAAVQRHPILRTSFDLEHYSEPLQMVYCNVQFHVGMTDLRDLPEQEQEQEIAQFIDAEKLRRFDLTRPEQFRLHVHSRSEETIQFTLTENHAILDGWSLHGLLSEIFGTYFLLLKGHENVFEPPLRTTYRDFIALELSAAESGEKKEFWAKALEDATACELPSANHRESPESRIELRRVDIPKEQAASLRNVAKLVGSPLRSVLLAAHTKVLSVITGSRDVLTGMFVHGRPATVEGDQVRGLFLNAVPFRQHVAFGSWQDLIRSTVQTEEELLPYSNYPFPLIQQNTGGRQLFEAVFNYVHFHVADGLLHSKEVEILDFKKYEATNYKLVAGFSINPVTSKLSLELEYDSSEVSAQQADLWARYYALVLCAIASDPSAHHETVSFLSESERQQAIDDPNRFFSPAKYCNFAHRLFEQQVARTPDAPSVLFEGLQLTYAELNRLANNLAWYLLDNGVRPDQIVALCMNRTHQALIALLAVMKAGAAYVWIDPSLPRERVSFILEDVRNPIVISETGVSNVLPEGQVEVFLIDTAVDLLSGQREENPNVQLHAANVVYLVYTSGSSGTPKAVAVSHHNLSSFIEVQQKRMQVTPGTPILQLFSFAFDASVWEWIMLLTGAKLVMIRSAQLSGQELKQLIEASGVQELLITPSMLRAIPHGGLPELHTIHIGAEPLGADLIANWAPGRRVFNCYGPTETTVVVTVTDPLQPNGVPPIGKPLPNAAVFVLDDAMLPCPVGARGELYIGGDCVARGYWNRPDTTAERFVPDPFSGQVGARLYRTGDAVKWSHDGNLRFIERVDQQVKIRGFRVETCEIESALISYPGIREAAVIVVEDDSGDKRLAAYIVPDDVISEERSLDSRAIREHLRAILPEYMVPFAIVRIDKMPISRHGKLDRKLLPRTSGERAEEHVAPQGETEKTLAAIWSEVLKVEHIGQNDNFFVLGGHSLLAVQMISRVREIFHVDIPVRTVFVDAVTLSALAATVDQSRPSQSTSNVPKITGRDRKPIDLQETVSKISALSEEEAKKILSHAKASPR
jgi:amino acid adenylation domain-containing protein